MSKTALLLGATGETGKEVLKHLIQSADVAKVILVGRREIELPPESSGKVEQRIVDFDNLDASKDSFKDAEIAYCCLGTTRGKAGKEGFIKVDYDYVVNSAKLLKEAGCQDYHLLTSKGSNASSFFLYPQIKGKAEEAIKAVGFDRVAIYRPGLLMCDRQESRVGERMMRGLASVIDKSENFSISTDKLGKAMVVNSLKADADKTQTLEHDAIMKLVP